MPKYHRYVANRQVVRLGHISDGRKANRVPLQRCCSCLGTQNIGLVLFLQRKKEKNVKASSGHCSITITNPPIGQDTMHEQKHVRLHPAPFGATPCWTAHVERGTSLAACASWVPVRPHWRVSGSHGPSDFWYHLNAKRAEFGAMNSSFSLNNKQSRHSQQTPAWPAMPMWDPKTLLGAAVNNDRARDHAGRLGRKFAALSQDTGKMQQNNPHFGSQRCDGFKSEQYPKSRSKTAYMINTSHSVGWSGNRLYEVMKHGSLVPKTCLDWKNAGAVFCPHCCIVARRGCRINITHLGNTSGRVQRMNAVNHCITETR